MQPLKAVILISYYDAPVQKSINLKMPPGIHKGNVGKETENPIPVPECFWSSSETLAKKRP